jgi:hypothetical protein
MPLACLLTLAVAASPRPPTVRRERVTKKTSSVVSRPNQAQSSSRHEGAAMLQVLRNRFQAIVEEMGG